MEHDPTHRSEQKAELQANAYDLEKLTPGQVAWLITALSAADDAERKSNKFDRHGPTYTGDVLAILGRNMEGLAKGAPGRAVQLYLTFIKHDEETKLMAINHLAGPLIKQYFDDHGVRQAIIDGWVGLMHDKDDLVREAARDELSSLNYGADWARTNLPGN